jgi:hypothetical protein
MIYFSYFHAVMSYGIIFWGNSSHSGNIFKLQTRVIRITTNSRSRESCRDLFKKLDILPLYSQYIYSLLNVVTDNIGLFKTNTELYNINTRSKNNLHLPQPRLSTYQKGIYYIGIKTFNHLPSYMKNLLYNKKQFKTTLKNHLLVISFYSLEEFFNSKYWSKMT